MAVVSVLMLIINIKNLINDSNDCPNWLVVLKHTSTVAVSVTFVTVVFLLAPSYAILGKGYFTLFLGTHVYMHLLNPLLAIISFVFFENWRKISFKESLLGLIPVGLYAILYITMVVIVGEANGGWRDFYNFTFGGHNWVIPFSVIGMLLMTFLISIVLTKWHNKKCEK